MTSRSSTSFIREVKEKTGKKKKVNKKKHKTMKNILVQEKILIVSKYIFKHFFKQGSISAFFYLIFYILPIKGSAPKISVSIAST